MADTVYFLALQGLLERVKKNMIESCKNTDESNQVCTHATGCSQSQARCEGLTRGFARMFCCCPCLCTALDETNDDPGKLNDVVFEGFGCL
jgi:hypothetical protein